MAVLCAAACWGVGGALSAWPCPTICESSVARKPIGSSKGSAAGAWRQRFRHCSAAYTPPARQPGSLLAYRNTLARLDGTGVSARVGTGVWGWVTRTGGRLRAGETPLLIARS